MRVLATLLTLLIAGCVAAPQHCRLLKGLEPLEGRSLVAQVDFDSALARLLDDPEPLPPEPRQALVRWFEGEWHETTRGLPRDATVWWFKSPKVVSVIARGS